MRIVLAMLLAVGVSGCAFAPHQIIDRDDYLAEATRTYKGEDRERVIRAAETVLKQSDPDNIEMRYTPNGFQALRKYFVYAVIAAARGREKWDFSVEEAKGAQVATLSVTEQGVSASGSSIRSYDNNMNQVPLYRLFWKRVDYLLGLRPDWTTCDQESAALQAANINATTSLSGLCGPTSAGRNLPPPEPLAPASRSPRSRGPVASR